MKRLLTAVKKRLSRRLRPNNKWTDYDEFMKMNFPHVIASRDKHYH